MEFEEIGKAMDSLGRTRGRERPSWRIPAASSIYGFHNVVVVLRRSIRIGGRILPVRAVMVQEEDEQAEAIKRTKSRKLEVISV